MSDRRMHSCGPFVLMGLLLVASCGAPDTRVRDAANASYRIRRDSLWSEIIGAVGTRYPKMQIAELQADRLVTHWTETHWRIPLRVQGGGPWVRGPTAPLLVRVTVTISGTNPYRVAADVHAGLWLSGPAPIELRHDAEEPEWVPQQKDELTIAIHDRLKAVQHAP